MTTFNNITTRYTYDDAHRLIDLSSSVADYQLTDIDGNGNRKAVTQTEPLSASIAVGTTGYAYSTAQADVLLSRETA